jgi:hypothetical protein
MSASEDTLNDDSFKISPMCNNKDKICLIPLEKNEAYRISFEDKRGYTISKTKKVKPRKLKT